jgi:hypothetical protein
MALLSLNGKLIKRRSFMVTRAPKKSPLWSTEGKFNQTLFVCPLFRFKAPGKLISAKDVVFIGVFNWKGK